MKYSLRTYLVTCTLIFFGCNGHDKQRIELRGFSDNVEVIYDTKNAKFFFGQNNLIDYCNKKDSTEHNNFIYKQVINYLKQNQSNSITIPDTLGTELVPDSTVNHFSTIDTLVRVRNQKSQYSYVTDAIRWTLLDLAKEGKIKIYDESAREFVDFIIIDEVETSGYGETNIHLPNDSIIFSQLRWIR